MKIGRFNEQVCVLTNIVKEENLDRGCTDIVFQIWGIVLLDSKRVKGFICRLS